MEVQKQTLTSGKLRIYDYFSFTFLLEFQLSQIPAVAEPWVVKIPAVTSCETCFQRVLSPLFKSRLLGICCPHRHYPHQSLLPGGGVCVWSTHTHTHTCQHAACARLIYGSSLRVFDALRCGLSSCSGL